MDGQRHRRTFIRRVLPISIFRWGEREGHTTITSSPITSTSGFLKCLRAHMAANDAQSNMFPASFRKCSVKRNCQTYHQLQSIVKDNTLTFSPARIQSASRSTASVLLILFSSSLVIITSSSDALSSVPSWDWEHTDHAHKRSKPWDWFRNLSIKTLHTVYRPWAWPCRHVFVRSPLPISIQH